MRAALRATADELGDPQADDTTLVAALQRFSDEDRKFTPLKALQGEIWAAGYADGTLRGHVYPDTRPFLVAVRARGIRLAVYSSGSVAAQRLIFGHSTAGDLTPFFEAYFDTTIGAKTESASYGRIAEALDVRAHETLFLSDSERELDAASEAGLRAARLLRPADSEEGATSRYPTAVDLAVVAMWLAQAEGLPTQSL